MDQTQGADSDLQKAIDNITNATSVDPVFSDPVAAPSSIPEGEEMGPIEAIGPFEEEPIMPEPAMPAADDIKETTKAPKVTGDMRHTKEEAIKDLVPIIDRIHINPSQKFRIYREFFEMLHDYSVIEPAYNTAKEIQDETERAENLLYILNVIDNM